MSSPDASTDPGDGSPAPRDRILVLMAPTRDRSLLEQWLGNQYDVVVDTDPDALDQPFDCCLVDRATFARHHDALAERKRRAQPTFLPYVLVLTGGERRTDDPRIWEHVDELVRTPSRKAELQSRLIGLLSRRALSKALAQQEERYRRILRTIPDPVCVVDDDGTVVESNPAFEAHIARGRAPVEGATLRSFESLGEEAVTALEQLADRTPRADRPEDAAIAATSIDFSGPDGTQRSAEVAVAVIRTSPGGPDGTLFVFRDVTERRERERSIERERERLNEFASMLAHEVRNPLNVAQGYLQELSPDSEDEQEAMQHVVDAQARMEQMIKELLAHARGGSVETVQSVTLREMAESAWELSGRGEATLENDLGDQTVEADPELLKTILENLFRNAVVHAGPGVTVRIDGLESGGFYVEDDGVGIPPEDRDRVFESGFTTSAAGSGLGLALVRQMADAHGWDVRATESAAGGARLEFTVRD